MIADVATIGLVVVIGLGLSAGVMVFLSWTKPR